MAKNSLVIPIRRTIFELQTQKSRAKKMGHHANGTGAAIRFELTFLSGETHDFIVEKRCLVGERYYSVAALRQRVSSEARSGKLEILRKYISCPQGSPQVVCVPPQTLAFFTADDFQPVDGSIDIDEAVAHWMQSAPADHSHELSDLPTVRLSVVVRYFPDLNLRCMLQNFLQDDDYFEFIDRVFQKADSERSFERPLLDLQGTETNRLKERYENNEEGTSSASSVETTRSDDNHDDGRQHGNARYEIINGQRLRVVAQNELHANPRVGLFAHTEEEEQRLQSRLPSKDDIEVAVFQFVTGVSSSIETEPEQDEILDTATLTEGHEDEGSRVSSDISKRKDEHWGAGAGKDIIEGIDCEMVEKKQTACLLSPSRNDGNRRSHSSSSVSTAEPSFIDDVMPEAIVEKIWIDLRGRFLLTKLSHAMRFHYAPSSMFVFVWILSYLLDYADRVVDFPTIGKIGEKTSPRNDDTGEERCHLFLMKMNGSSLKEGKGFTDRTPVGAFLFFVQNNFAFCRDDLGLKETGRILETLLRKCLTEADSDNVRRVAHDGSDCSRFLRPILDNYVV